VTRCAGRCCRGVPSRRRTPAGDNAVGPRRLSPPWGLTRQPRSPIDVLFTHTKDNRANAPLSCLRRRMALLFALLQSSKANTCSAPPLATILPPTHGPLGWTGGALERHWAPGGRLLLLPDVDDAGKRLGGFEPQCARSGLCQLRIPLGGWRRSPHSPRGVQENYIWADLCGKHKMRCRPQIC